MITLTVAGVNYKDFVSASANSSLGTISGTFNFTATATATEVLPVKPGQTCTVLVDDIAVITGYIEIVNIQYDDSSHTISISGRDKTADLVDCTMLAEESDFNGKISFKKLCETAIEKSGVKGVSVVDEAKAEDFDEISLESASVGETVHAFLEKYARKRQVILTSNGDGNLVIVKPAALKAKTKLVNGININRGGLVINLSNRFRTYIVKSQAGLSSTDDGGDINLEDATNSEGKVVDGAIREGRTLTIIDENANYKGGAQKRARWEALIRRANSVTANVTIQGSGDGEVIIPNMRIEYQEQYGKGALPSALPMLVKSASYSFDITRGSETSLNLVRQNAYTLDLQSVEFEKDFIEKQVEADAQQHEANPDADVE